MSVSCNTSAIVAFRYFFHSQGGPVRRIWHGQELVVHTAASAKVCGEDAKLSTLKLKEGDVRIEHEKEYKYLYI